MYAYDIKNDFMEKLRKVLFIHNTLPEYRVQFFSELVKFVDLTLVITDQKLASTVYQLNSTVPDTLKVVNVDNAETIKQIIDGNDWGIVVLPPVDTPYQAKCAYFALKASKLKGIKTIYWTEKWEAPLNMQPFAKKLKNRIQAMLISYFAKRADLCIAAGSMSEKYYLALGVKPSKIRIALDSSTSPVVVENINIRKQYKIPQEAKIVLFLSRVVKRKGCDLLVKALQTLSNKSIYLLICGEGEQLSEVKKLVEEEKVENVIFCGKIQPNNRAAYFTQSDVFVLPSYTLNGVIEAWGLTCNEALEQGTPVIGTTAVGAVHDLSDGECCLMVKENDIDALAMGVKDILSKGNLENKCKERYIKFSVENMAKSFYETFKSC